MFSCYFVPPLSLISVLLKKDSSTSNSVSQPISETSKSFVLKTVCPDACTQIRINCSHTLSPLI